METCTGIMYILFTLLLCELTWSENCTELNPCVGHRPKSDNGCCLGNQGSPCGVATGRICDGELGFSCNETNAVCEGKYHLTAIDIGMKSLTISWEDFKPQNYLYEYSILLTTVYTPDTTKWENVQTGIDSYVTLNNLHPDTLYFMRVGTWRNPFKDFYHVLTEVIMVHTKAAEFCLYNGKRIGVGEVFEIQCEDRCVCHTDGLLQCDPVCSSSEKGKLQDPRYDCNEYWASDPCCPVIDCHLLELYCKYQGEKLPDGYQWRIGCQEACQCFNGSVTCEPVCSETQPPQNCDGPVLRQDNESCCGHWECTDFTRNKNSNVNVSLRILEISTTAVSIESRILPRYRDHLVSAIKILWSATRSQNISSFITNSSSSLHTISGLEQNTLYALWLEVLLNNGAIINSTEVHFITKDSNVISAGPPAFHPNTAFVVSIPVISVIAVLLLVVAIVYTSRTRRKGSKHISEHSDDTIITEMPIGKYEEFESSDVSVTDVNMPSTITDLQHP